MSHSLLKPVKNQSLHCPNQSDDSDDVSKTKMCTGFSLKKKQISL